MKLIKLQKNSFMKTLSPSITLIYHSIFLWFYLCGCQGQPFKLHIAGVHPQNERFIGDKFIA